MQALSTETAIIPYQSPETTILYSIWKTDHSYLPNFWVWDRVGDRCKALAAEKTSFLAEAYFDAFMILNWGNQVWDTSLMSSTSSGDLAFPTFPDIYKPELRDAVWDF